MLMGETIACFLRRSFELSSDKFDIYREIYDLKWKLSE
jgi:hypothetical protein